ncbi:MAG: pyrroline-5-carboxylate reductase family protein, partial [Peptostreptococcaceae bacterium]
MSKTIGFIGCGNMSKAMIGGIVKSGVIEPENITVSDLKQSFLDATNAEYNVNITTDSKEVVKNSDIV